MLYSDIWGLQPGVQPAAETYEAAFRWGPAGQGLITGGTISSLASDPGNVPTYELRPGLLLGMRVADGTWTNYSATATDGSEVAQGVLLTGIRMQNILTGLNQARFYGVLVGGPIKASGLLGLDLMARAQMTDHFSFDDAPNYGGAHWFPYRRFVSKTANYQILASDNFTVFDTTGAIAEVDFTLPAITNGLFYGFRNTVGQTMKVISTEGTNIVAFNNASASSLAFQTGGNLIGGGFRVYSNPAATKWLAANESAGANTITVA